jgi:hypothetical protein
MPEQTRNLTSRTLCLRAQTANDEARSVEATIATETPVEVYDWWEGTRVVEVLLMSGVRMPDNNQLPLLAVHSRYGLDDVLGSARSLRNDGTELMATLYFAGDEESRKAWDKTRDGHITDVSVGYRVNSSITVKPGSSATIAGKTFNADKMPLRVTTDWTLKEVSLVPIGADTRAKIRSDDSPAINDSNQETQTMAEELRTDQPIEVEPKTVAEPEVRTVDSGDTARQAVEAERARVKSLRELARDDVPADLLTRAIDDGWDEHQASKEFLSAIRAARKPDASGVPYHQTAHTGRLDGPVRAITAGLITGAGLDPTKAIPHNGIRAGKPSEKFTDAEAEAGYEYRSMSSVDVLRACIHADTGRWPKTIEAAFEMLRATPTSGTSLSYAFTTSVYASLLAGWETVGDTTTGWCDEEDVANFMLHDNISLSHETRPKALPAGATAQHATMSDAREQYRCARYALQFSLDEQTIIDDRLGVLSSMAAQMGEGCRALRPELVYSEILANPTMADTGQMFNATAVTTTGGHANYGSGASSALSSTSLKTGIAAVMAQREGRTAVDPGKVIGAIPRYLIVPSDLMWTAQDLCQPGALIKLFADSADPVYSQRNPFAQMGIMPVIDDRIGAVGVVDPRTSAVRTGTATNWFMTTGGRRGLRVVYRRGTNRQPQMRSYVHDKGQWGMGYDINFDIGVKFIDFRSWYMSDGA